MSWLIWLILWGVISLLPVGTAIGKLFSKNGEANGELLGWKFVISIIVGIILILANTPNAYMWWIIAFFGLLWIAAELIVMETSSAVKGVSIAVLAIFIISALYVGATAGLNNAVYFDQFVVKKEGFPIQNEISDNMIRLTTEELAQMNAKTRSSEFGSNTHIIDMQITKYDNKNSWAALVAQEKSWGALFNVEGILITDVNKPDETPTILKEKLAIADGLTFWPWWPVGASGNAGANGYYGISTDNKYGDAYPVFNGKNWFTALNAYKPDWKGIRHYEGVYVFDQKGNLVEKYSKNNIPTWLIQPFPESGFLESGITDWGYHRDSTEEDGFKYWSNGLASIKASNDRVEISEDTRYIYDPDTDSIVAMVFVHPKRDRGELSLAGAFKITAGEIAYYDLSKYDLMSGVTAGSVIKSKISQRAGTEYFTSMELLYPLKIGNQTRYAWFVPVYTRAEDTGMITLGGLGIVDAQDKNNWAVEYTEHGITGPGLVKKTKESFRDLYAGKKLEVSKCACEKGTNFEVIIKDNQGKETIVPLPQNATISIVQQ